MKRIFFVAYKVDSTGLYNYQRYLFEKFLVIP